MARKRKYEPGTPVNIHGLDGSITATGVVKELVPEDRSATVTIDGTGKVEYYFTCWLSKRTPCTQLSLETLVKWQLPRIRL